MRLVTGNTVRQPTYLRCVQVSYPRNNLTNTDGTSIDVRVVFVRWLRVLRRAWGHEWH